MMMKTFLQYLIYGAEFNLHYIKCISFHTNLGLHLVKRGQILPTLSTVRGSKSWSGAAHGGMGMESFSRFR